MKIGYQGLGEEHVGDNMSSIQYQPHIDGLRAVAIVPVILFHLGMDRIPGGYLGVDVFFVISGFLITSILLREMTAGTFSFKRFWARRIRRILPALVVVTVAAVAATWVWEFPPDRPAIGRQALATLLSVANFYFWRHANDYWGPQAEDSPFLHAWSLAVEEQFYLLYPMFVFAVNRWAPRRLTVGLAAIIVTSLGLFLIGVQTRPSATFYLLPTRAWELATGGLLAAILQSQARAQVPVRGAAVVAGAGLCATLASYVLVPDLSGWAVVPVIGAALVIWCGAHGWVNQVLSHPAAVYIGKTSYSLYLWHWPVIVLSRQLGYEAPALLLALAIGLLAVASYHLVEEPFRRRPAVIPRIAGGFAAAVTAAGFLTTWPVPRCDVSQFDPLHTYSRSYDIHPHRVETAGWLEKYGLSDIPQAVATPDAYRSNGIVTGSGSGPPAVVVLGDSHGGMWAHAIRVATEEAGLKAAFYCMGGVRPFFEFPPKLNDHAWNLSASEKHEYDTVRIRNIEEWKPSVVIVCARWAITKQEDTDALVGFVHRHAGRVVLVEQPPELMGVGTHSLAQVAAFRGVRPESGRKQFWPAGNTRACEAGTKGIQHVASRYANCTVMPTRDLYAQGDRVWFLVSRRA